MYTYEELNTKSFDDLVKIKHNLQEEIAKKESSRQNLIRDIMYIQNMSDLSDFRKTLEEPTAIVEVYFNCAAFESTDLKDFFQIDDSTKAMVTGFSTAEVNGRQYHYDAQAKTLSLQ